LRHALEKHVVPNSSFKRSAFEEKTIDIIFQLSRRQPAVATEIPRCETHVREIPYRKSTRKSRKQPGEKCG